MLLLVLGYKTLSRSNGPDAIKLMTFQTVQYVERTPPKSIQYESINYIYS